jgi:hypothetical protein
VMCPEPCPPPGLWGAVSLQSSILRCQSGLHVDSRVGASTNASPLMPNVN